MKVTCHKIVGKNSLPSLHQVSIVYLLILIFIKKELMNTYRDMYAVQVCNKRKAGRPPRYLIGFNTRSDAESKMNNLPKDAYACKVVYVREYFQRVVDQEGHTSVHSITEIPEYYSI